MSIKRAPSVEDEPTVTLVEWRVIRTDRGTLHVVGRLAGALYCRMSSPIKSFDARQLQGTTTSGRAYRLSGPAGENLNTIRAGLEPELAAAAHGWDDVTDEVCALRH